MTFERKYAKRGRDLEKELKRCQGALADVAIRDEEARRRPGVLDSDAWIRGFETPFRHDRTKGLRCKMARRLGRKTQVITVPLNSHTRDREDHCMESAAIAVDCACILGMNVDLVETGMLLHDCGHMPGGHAAEDFLTARTGKKWRHNILGAVIAQHVERKGRGLGLTWQVLDIIVSHSRGSAAATVDGMRPEPAMSVLADKIAYTFGDINDIFQREALMAQGFTAKRYPHIAEAADWFGGSQREREFTCVANLCIESAEKGRISFSECEAAKRFEQLKLMMYDDVYTRIDRRIVNLKMAVVYDALVVALKDEEVEPALVFALMDDYELEWLFNKSSRNETINLETLRMISVGEIIPHIRGKVIDVTDPDLGW